MNKRIWIEGIIIAVLFIIIQAVSDVVQGIYNTMKFNNEITEAMFSESDAMFTATTTTQVHFGKGWLSPNAIFGVKTLITGIIFVMFYVLVISILRKVYTKPEVNRTID